MRARKRKPPSQRYKWDIDRSVDAFFSGAYEKEIEGVSDEDDEDGENLIEKTGGKNGARRRDEERMADSPEDESVSEYNTGDDDPDFVEIDSDEEMEQLMNLETNEREKAVTDCRFDREYSETDEFTSWEWRSQTLGEKGARGGESYGKRWRTSEWEFVAHDARRGGEPRRRRPG